MDTTEIGIIYDSSMDKMETTEIKINSDHVQTIQQDKMFVLYEKKVYHVSGQVNKIMIQNLMKITQFVRMMKIQWVVMILWSCGGDV